MASLEGKVALVTGASKGIGAAIAKAFAAHGAAVVVAYASSKSGADAVVDEITGQGGKAVVVAGDVSKETDAANLVRTAIDEFGRLDILVNNSGVYAFGPIEEVSEAEFHRQFNTNVLGLLLVTKAAVKHLADGASIINIGSAASHVPRAGSVIYTGTKAAVDAVTGVLAQELGSRKIRVNSINPGYVVTEGTHSAGFPGSDAEADMIARTVLGRAGQPDDVADIAVFLASDQARWMTGEILLATGGMH